MGNKIMNWTFCKLIILDFYPSVRNVYAKLEEILLESESDSLEFKSSLIVPTEPDKYIIGLKREYQSLLRK